MDDGCIIKHSQNRDVFSHTVPVNRSTYKKSLFQYAYVFLPISPLTAVAKWNRLPLPDEHSYEVHICLRMIDTSDDTHWSVIFQKFLMVGLVKILLKPVHYHLSGNVSFVIRIPIGNNSCRRFVMGFQTRISPLRT